MRIASPLVTSSKITLPKSSVTAAKVLHGERHILSPWRRESGSPNLKKERKKEIKTKSKKIRYLFFFRISKQSIF